MLPRHAESLARRHGDSGENLARKHDIHCAGKSGISVPQYGDGGDVYERRRGAAGNSAKVARRVGSQRRIGTLSCCGPGESLRFQPVVEFVDPVVAAGTLLSHAEAMAASAENVSFRF